MRSVELGVSMVHSLPEKHNILWSVKKDRGKLGEILFLMTVEKGRKL